MRDLFPGFYIPTAEQFAQLWADCLLVVDANVLLNLYRFPKEASQDLMAILRSFGDRLWIPHQVALEYQRNRLHVRAEQLGKFGEVRKVLQDAEEKLKGGLDALRLEKRHSSIKTKDFTTRITTEFGEFREQLTALERDQRRVTEQDTLRDEIDSLLAGKIGPAPSQQADLDRIFGEGEERYKIKRPPGYMDVQKEKSDAPYVYRGLTYHPQFGDLVLWSQLLQHAKETSREAVLLITDDDKEDWWSIESPGRQTLGPRPELVDEIASVSGVSTFWMYNSQRFLTQAEEGKHRVRAESIEQVRDITQILAPPLSDVVADFSNDSNPAGLWSYGYSNALGGQFILHASKETDVFPGVDRWASPEIERNIGVMHNRTRDIITGNPPTYTIPPDMLHMHPGADGIYDVIRWTCPRRGQYTVQGLYSGLDFQTSIADTDVHVVVNLTTSLFSSVLYGAGTQKPFALDTGLHDGDTLDFVVGVGPSRSHGADSTGLKATITQTR